MNPDINKLIARIDALEKELATYRQSNTIPLPVQKAFSGRGFFFSKDFEGEPDPAIYLQLNSLTGNPEDIFTLGFPSKWAKLEGTQFFVPLYSQFN